MALLPVDDAIARILKGAAPTEVEHVALLEAHGRYLAEPLAATRNQPPFAASAMDGYAVVAGDLEELPVTLNVIGVSAAGNGFSGSVLSGQAVRIFTGAPVPDGADAIVIQEDTHADGDRVTVTESATPGRYIRPEGLDFRTGEVLLEPPRLMGTREIGLAAAMNHARVPVRRRPRIAILPTGDELVMPGDDPGPDQIIASNNFALASFTRSFGAGPFDLGIAGDTEQDLADAIRRARALDADILVTLGGASVGDHDLVHAALIAAGMTAEFWRIAMRPGKPLMFGRIGDMRVLGLPGNPVSSIVCAHVFLRPLIAALLGRTDDAITVQANLDGELSANDERQDYMRATLSTDTDGNRTVRPFDRQDSSMLRTLAEADCLIVRPAHDAPKRPGDRLSVMPIDF